jgi:enoyl-CoA hydratase
VSVSFVVTDRPAPHVRRVLLNRPERMNALSFDTALPLLAALREAGADNDCRVVILTGAGRGFCSGLDLEDAGLPPNVEGLPLSRLAVRAMETMASLVPALRELPQPVIAAVNGPAFGGGLCLAAGADIRLAAASARFCGAGISNGLTGTELGVSWLLPRLVGAARAWEILLSGREVDAAEAERIGLVARTVPDAELEAESLELAGRIARLSAHGVSMTKRVLWANLEGTSLVQAMDLENRNQLLVRLTTGNLDEAIRARREGREPEYVD